MKKASKKNVVGTETQRIGEKALQDIHIEYHPYHSQC